MSKMAEDKMDEKRRTYYPPTPVKYDLKDRNKIYLKMLKKYGGKSQTLVCIEEMAELTKELLKNINREQTNRHAIIEEIIDVAIMIEQMIELFDVTYNETTSLYNKKIDRLVEMLDE
jgi:predicted transcriptional regulator